jgi:hypothetical protein
MNIELLDPLCTMVKLIQLNFHNNTKLSIHDHIVSLHPQSQYLCITRYINGDSRNNISNLYYVIIRLIKWFIVESSENIISKNEDNHTDEIIESEEDTKHDDKNTKSGSLKSTDSGNFLEKYIKKKDTNPFINKYGYTNQQIISNNDKFRKLVIFFVKALENLQHTYKEGLVVLSLQFYINCLNAALNGTFDEQLLPKTLDDEEYGVNNLLDYNKIKNFWDVKDIEYIYGLYDECFTIQSDTSHMPESKITYINGKIKNVDSILEMNEKKFISLIKNNTKG